jgi:hypothetical protein
MDSSAKRSREGQENLDEGARRAGPLAAIARIALASFRLPTRMAAAFSEHPEMNNVIRPRWLAIFAIAALSLGGIRLAAQRLLPGAHQRLVQQYCQQIKTLPDEKAARFVARLSKNDAEWAEVLIAATADERGLVASTAERELRSLMLRLGQLPGDQRSPHAARLARALATTAPTLPPDRRSLPASLANELVAWPIDSRTIDAAQFIADCESVLLLPITEQAEVRLAAAPSPPEVPLQELSPPPLFIPELVPVESTLAESTSQPPPVVITPEPASPPVSAPPSPNEPQRFVPGRSTRISDD